MNAKRVLGMTVVGVAALCCVVTILSAPAVRADTPRTTKVYKDGPDKLVVGSGGTIEVQSGGTLTITDGAFEAPDLAVTQGSVIVGDADGEGTALDASGDDYILVGNGTTVASVAVSGDVTLNSNGTVTIADLARAKLATETKRYGVPLPTFVKFDALKDALPDAPDGTYLGLGDGALAKVTGTTTNSNGTASADEWLAATFVLPAEYVDAGTITLRVRAKVSVARQVSATVDAVVQQKEEDGGQGGDLVTTAPQSLTTSYANYDFTVTPTGLVAGDVLHLQGGLATDDTGGGSDGYPLATQVSVFCQVKG